MKGEIKNIEGIDYRVYTYPTKTGVKIVKQKIRSSKGQRELLTKELTNIKGIKYYIYTYRHNNGTIETVKCKYTPKHIENSEFTDEDLNYEF